MFPVVPLVLLPRSFLMSTGSSDTHYSPDSSGAHSSGAHSSGVPSSEASSSGEASPAERAHVALFVDFANLRQQMRTAAEAASSSSDSSSSESSDAEATPPSPVSISEIARSLVRFAGGVGRVGVARAYADWSREPSLARELNGTRLVPVLVPATDDGEDRSHIRLTVDAMESLFNGDEPDAFVIVSNDPSLVPLVQAIRGDGSEVILVAADAATADELRTESDSFTSFDEVLRGAVGAAVRPRNFGDRERPGQERASDGARAAPSQGGRDRGYYSSTPLLTEPDFENYDWDGFIRLIDELEQRLPFVGVRYLVNKVLGPHNCGISDPHIKRDLINEAVDDGLIEMYTVGNVNERTDPVTACRLDRQNPRVAETLGPDTAEEDHAGSEGVGSERVRSEEGVEGDDDLVALAREDTSLLPGAAPDGFFVSTP